MSAFLVTKEHIDGLVNAGLAGGWGDGAHLSWYVGETRYELRPDNADNVGRELWRENALSVAHRYAEAPAETASYAVAFSRPLVPVEVLKAIDCYEYQACEHPGWGGSSARAFCEALRHTTIRKLPGYKGAAWEVRT